MQNHNPSVIEASKINLLILEAKIDGHRPSYLRRVVECAINNGFRVTLAMPAENFNNPVIQSLIENFTTDQLHPVRCQSAPHSKPAGLSVIDLTTGEVALRRFYYSIFKKICATEKPDVVLITSFDHFANAASLLGSRFSGLPWVGIVMRQSFHFNEMGIIGPNTSFIGKVKKSLFIRLLRNLQRGSKILTIDLSLEDYVSEKHPELKSKIGYIPDPSGHVDDQESSNLRSSLKIPENGTVILIYGAILPGKGLGKLLAAFPVMPSNVHILLAGNQHPIVAQQLLEFETNFSQHASRIHQIIRYIKDDEESSIFKAADIVWLGYQGHYAMSGVMIQAARSHLPVIATDEGLIGWMVNKYKIGIVTDTKLPANVVNAVDNLTSKRVEISNTTYAEFYQNHSIDAFNQSLIGALKL